MMEKFLKLKEKFQENIDWKSFNNVLYFIVFLFLLMMSFYVIFYFCGNEKKISLHFKEDFASVSLTMFAIIVPTYIMAIQTSLKLGIKNINNRFFFDSSEKSKEKTKFVCTFLAAIATEVFVLLCIFISVFICIYFDVWLGFELLVELSLFFYAFGILLQLVLISVAGSILDL